MNPGARSRPSTSPKRSAGCARTRIGPLLVDVREADEFDAVRAPGAVLVPTSAFAARAGELPADRPLMVVCHVGGRSAAVAGFLVRSGRTDVVNVAGGMDAWERAGLPVRRGTPSSRARATSPADAASREAQSRRREDPARSVSRALLLVGERPADEQQEDEVDRAGARRIQVAELLADLAVDLEARDGRADQPELEERALRRGVRPDAGRDRTFGACAADEDGVRTRDDRRAARHAVGQVADVEVLPLGDVARGRRDGPVRLALRAVGALPADQVERPVGGPARSRRRAAPAGSPRC